jgi:hypothetical protein
MRILVFLVPVLFSISIPILLILGLVHIVRHRHTQATSRHLLIFLSFKDFISQFMMVGGLALAGVLALSFEYYFPDTTRFYLYLLATLAATAFLLGYATRAIHLVIVAILATIGWWLALFYGNNVQQFQELPMVVGVAIIGAISTLVGLQILSRPAFRRFSTVFLVIGCTILISLLFLFSLRSGLYTLHDLTRGTSFYKSWQITSSLAGMILVYLFTLYLTIHRLRLSLPEWAAILIPPCLLISLIGLSPTSHLFILPQGTNTVYYHDDPHYTFLALTLSTLFNLVVLGELLAALWSGYYRQVKSLVNVGVGGLFIFVIVKYVDWFYAFLDPSVFFLIIGILFFALGWFMEKTRRHMIARMQNPASEYVTVPPSDPTPVIHQDFPT